MKLISRRRLAGAALSLAVVVPVLNSPTTALAQGFPEPSGHVVDESGLLPAAMQDAVESRLRDYEAASGNEVAVAVLRSTGEKQIEDYAEQLFDEWGIGKKGEDNGVLIVLALTDRKLRIEVGYGVEDELTDLESSFIIRDRMVPKLRANDVAGAVEDGVSGVLEALGGELSGVPDVQPAPVRRQRTGSPVGLLILLFFAFSVVGSLGSRGRGRGRSGGGMLLPFIIGSSLGSMGSRGGYGGGGFGGGGGGGFGGFGGGGSGGGGASGDW